MVVNLLGIYLDDHRAGATAGLALARRFAASNASTYAHGTAAEVCRQIGEDVQTLEEIIERFDHSPSRWKMAVARAGELVGRLKLNGGLSRRYSPLSRLLELEMLSSGILAKESLWQALDVMSERCSELDGFDFEELQRRAQHQRTLLASLRRPSAIEAFVGADVGVPHVMA